MSEADALRVALESAEEAQADDQQQTEAR